MTKQTVGSVKLASWRKERVYTQEKLGELLGVTGAFISMLESGERIPGMQIAFNLKELAGINPLDWRRG